MIALRELSLRLRKLGVFRDVTFQAVPGAEPANLASFSFFLDAELRDVTRRCQASFGLSIAISLANENASIASTSIGWQSADDPGAGRATEWDNIDCEPLNGANAHDFFCEFPAYARNVMDQFETAAIAYDKLARNDV